MTLATAHFQMPVFFSSNLVYLHFRGGLNQPNCNSLMLFILNFIYREPDHIIKSVSASTDVAKRYWTVLSGINYIFFLPAKKKKKTVRHFMHCRREITIICTQSQSYDMFQMSGPGCSKHR